MHVAIRTGKIQPEKMDEVIRRVDTEFLAILSELPGFRSLYFVQTGDDEVVSINIFDSEAEAAESNKVALGWIKENLGPFVMGPIQAVTGKVVVHGGN